MVTAEKKQKLKDIAGIGLFIIAVVVGAWLINAMVFRPFNVMGPSMEPTMHTGDRLIVNRIPITIDALQGKSYLPSRGHVIVFRNPLFSDMHRDEFVVKRVIAFAGERVVVHNGTVRVYNTQYPQGFDPYDYASIPKTSVSGDVDRVVEAGTIFVIGDNRSGQESMDSRNGIGLVPLDNIVGPVAMRIYPFTQLSGDFN